MPRGAVPTFAQQWGGGTLDVHMAARRSSDQLPRMSRRRMAPRSDDKRPPLARIRSLVLEPGAERSRRILGRIRKELDETLEPGPWIAAARTLAAEGVITADAVYYFVEILLECITLHASGHDAEMLRLYAEIDKVKRAHGLRADEDWYIHEAPPEWQALNESWNERDREIRVRTLRGLGHEDIADVLERDPEEFGRREAGGHGDLWGADDAV